MALERVVWRACRETSKLLTCRERGGEISILEKGVLFGREGWGVMKSFCNGSENDFAVKWFWD